MFIFAAGESTVGFSSLWAVFLCIHLRVFYSTPNHFTRLTSNIVGWCPRLPYSNALTALFLPIAIGEYPFVQCARIWFPTLLAMLSGQQDIRNGLASRNLFADPGLEPGTLS